MLAGMQQLIIALIQIVEILRNWVKLHCEEAVCHSCLFEDCIQELKQTSKMVSIEIDKLSFEFSRQVVRNFRVNTFPLQIESQSEMKTLTSEEKFPVLSSRVHFKSSFV